ncbi:sulfatase [Planctomycetota bacterium]
MTSTSPIIQTDCVETVPAEKPYESLASILTRAGYRSGFFEMSKGNFECAPGLFSNLGFDWAWFRENLQDPSAYIGYMGGDDCRLIKPALDWIGEKDQPFLLMVITSIAHDPFEVPDWFEKPKENLNDRYLQTVRYTDHFLEQLCQKLKENGLDKNTILCVLGDHGTSFRAQKSKGRWVPYEEVIRVPWVIRWPGHLDAGYTVEWPCSQIDVTPTILKLIGFDITNAGFEGFDAMVKPVDKRRFYFSSLLSESPTGFVEDNMKIVYWPYLDKVFQYDLNIDPNEENPRVVSVEQAKKIKDDIMNWQEKTQIVIDARRQTRQLMYSHWKTFSAGSSAWAYYVP